MRRFLIISTVLTTVILLSASIAEARSSTSRVHNMREIAVATFGPTVCGQSIMTVPITVGPMLNRGWVAYSHHEGDGPVYTNCYIRLRNRRWDTEYLCRVIQHEFKHLSGWRAPEGQEFIYPDGTKDYSHSNDPFDLMWPYEIADYLPCANGAANTEKPA